MAEHTHTWTQAQIVFTPGATIHRPIAGAQVVWRCTGRTCDALRVSKYTFRRPSPKQAPNTWGRPSVGDDNFAESLYRNNKRKKKQSKAQTTDLEFAEL